ncbi:matrin 3-like 1.2 isoform X2 [Centroberyx affinis]|uniref:matrin 3-like 1.2 isoform X2 n=1 Tax=Centroberyx affinis TaxID=166261 RepID=UPI003A5BED1E
MSQKNQSDGGQKGFAVGRGLLAAAETLNFSMSEQRSGPAGRPMGGMVSGMGVGGGVDGQDCGSQMSRRGGGSHLGSTMKLFASLGLSPADLDALAQIPEENISVETLPQILMQLKSRKGDAGERRMAANPRDLPSMSSETSYRGGREDWDDMHMGRMGGPSMGQASARAQHPSDFGYGSMQDVSSARGYNLDYGNNSGGGGGSRERQYSELSHRDSYGGLGMGPSPSDPVFMQRRMGSPSHGKVQDFLGVMPPMFPHVCSLCDFDVHSTMEWNQHTNGLRHAENRRLLLEMYPDWDPGMASSRGGGSHLLETPNLSAGLLGPAPMAPGQSAGGMPSSWGGGGPGLSGKNQSHSGPKIRSRVVVAKYDRKPLSNKSLFSFCEPFGCLREHLVLKNKAFLEMDTHQEALDMVNYYQQHPASMYGKPVTFYLSKELMVIEKDDRPGNRPSREVKGRGSQVIFFSNLPREEEKKMELLTVAGRFGTVEKHLFLTDEAFVQLGTPEDAEMLVKYYTVNPLTIKGRPIHLNICTKYKTLNVSRRLGQGNFGGNSRGRRSSGATASSSSSGTKSSSKSPASKSTSSSSSAKTKEEKKKEATKHAAAEEKPGSEEEVAGVMEGEDGGEEEEEEMQVEEEEEQGEEEQGTDGEEEGKEEDRASTPAEEAEPAETATKPVQESGRAPEKVPGGGDITEEADGGVGGAKGEPGAGPEGRTGPMEAEASSEETEAKDEPSAEPGDGSEMNEGDLPENLEDLDFLENMEDFVTLDELAEDEDESHANRSDPVDKSRKGGMRVVNVVGFRRGYGFLNELLALAKPFGEVVKHLVLDLRPEAYLQFATEDEAKAMAKFYNSNVTASVCGRSVRISHSMTYPTIQCGSSRVVYIGQIPNIKYSDETVLKLAEPFGKVRKYFLNRIKRECFVEMENAEDAEKMAEVYKVTPPKIQGRRLNVYVSRKYKQLKYGHRRPTLPEDKKPSKRESSGTPVKSSKHTDEPPTKKAKEEEEEEAEEEEEEEEEEEKTDVKEMEKEKEKEEEKESSEATGAEQKSEEESAEKETKETIPEASDQPSGSDKQKSCDAEVKQQEEEEEASAGQNGQTEAPPPDTKPSAACLPLAPYEPNRPIGVEHVKMGYYCRVCFLFYSNEETAKRVHCSSQAHYDKLQKHLEKEQAKAQSSKKVKKTSSSSSSV